MDKTTLSMSDNAINHTIKLTVTDGKYYLTLDFRGLTIGDRLGYLSELKYYLTGYTLDEYGNPVGDLGDVTVDSYQTNEDGSRISDQYGTDYPDFVTFEMIPEALERRLCASSGICTYYGIHRKRVRNPAGVPEPGLEYH